MVKWFFLIVAATPVKKAMSFLRWVSIRFGFRRARKTDLYRFDTCFLWNIETNSNEHVSFKKIIFVSIIEPSDRIRLGDDSGLGSGRRRHGVLFAVPSAGQIAPLGAHFHALLRLHVRLLRPSPGGAQMGRAEHVKSPLSPRNAQSRGRQMALHFVLVNEAAPESERIHSHVVDRCPHPSSHRDFVLFLLYYYYYHDYYYFSPPRWFLPIQTHTHTRSPSLRSPLIVNNVQSFFF